MSALALAPVLGLATPAAANSSCSAWQHHEFDTNWYNTDMSIEVCVERDVTGVYRAWAMIDWQEGGSNKFNNLDLHLRLEKYDVVVKGAVCDFTDEVNSREADGGVLCQVPWTSTTPGGLTGDATVLYDIADDGLGEKRWDLGGSPSM
ncbi:hypothetical protein ABZX90_20540 [Streptomyces sp. NPDC002935]|uniref:hypothetical protein n=1 Tax=unclassified Streptomyces TaxID=2593676 RepID=UPI00332FC98E